MQGQMAAGMQIKTTTGPGEAAPPRVRAIFQSGQRLPVGSTRASTSVSTVTSTIQIHAVYLTILEQRTGSKFGSPISIDELALRKRSKRGPNTTIPKIQIRA